MLAAVEKEKIEFTGIEVCTEPFNYFILPQAFGEKESSLILNWFETEAPWKLVEADFYTQYEFDFEEMDLPEEISFLNQKNFLNYLTEQFEDIFSVELAKQVDITAHKLIKGQTIRLHNDYILGQETHRLLIQLNHNWQDENGGFLIFFNSSDSKDVHRVIRPVHNSSVGFAISPKSNHAVSTIHDGERYTLVYSFYAADHSNKFKG